MNLYLMPWPHTPAPVPSFVLDPSVYQMSPLLPKGAVPLSHSLLSGNLTVNVLCNAYLGIILSVLVYKMSSLIMSRDLLTSPYHKGFGFHFIAVKSINSSPGLSLYLQTKRRDPQKNLNCSGRSRSQAPVIPMQASLCNLLSMTRLVLYFSISLQIMAA
jgi:hypothetical protein